MRRYIKFQITQKVGFLKFQISDFIDLIINEWKLYISFICVNYCLSLEQKFGFKDQECSESYI